MGRLSLYGIFIPGPDSSGKQPIRRKSGRLHVLLEQVVLERDALGERCGNPAECRCRLNAIPPERGKPEKAGAAGIETYDGRAVIDERAQARPLMAHVLYLKCCRPLDAIYCDRNVEFIRMDVARFH